MAYGLGTALKIDEKEFYSPITRQIDNILLLLIAFVLSGILLLYWAMLSLLRKLAIPEQINRQSNKALYSAKKQTEQASTELSAYIDAIGKLNLISITDRSGCILQANKKFCHVSGYTEAELIGNNHRLINSGDHPEIFLSICENHSTW